MEPTNNQLQVEKEGTDSSSEMTNEYHGGSNNKNPSSDSIDLENLRTLDISKYNKNDRVDSARTNNSNVNIRGSRGGGLARVRGRGTRGGNGTGRRGSGNSRARGVKGAGRNSSGNDPKQSQRTIKSRIHQSKRKQLDEIRVELKSESESDGEMDKEIISNMHTNLDLKHQMAIRRLGLRRGV